MKEKDLDLLLALIEGRLSAEEIAAAEARVSEDPELQSELAMQRLAVARLGRLSRPSLTTAERDGLHGALRTQLHLAPPVPAAAPPSRWRSRWIAITGLAAAAVVVVGLVYVIPRTADQGTTATDVVAFDVPETEAGAPTESAPRSAANSAEPTDTAGASATTAAAADEADGDVSADPGTALQPLVPGESAPDDGSPQNEPESEGATTVAPDEGGGTEPAEEPIAEEPPAVDLITIGDLGGDVPAAADLLEDLGGETANGQEAIAYFAAGATTTLDPADFNACAGALDAVGGGRAAVPVATGTRGGEEVVVAVFDATADAPSTVAVVALDGCTVVDSAP